MYEMIIPDYLILYVIRMDTYAYLTAIQHGYTIL